MATTIVAAFEERLRSDEGQRAMREESHEPETTRVLVEFTPLAASEVDRPRRLAPAGDRARNEMARGAGATRARMPGGGIVGAACAVR